MFLLPYYWAVLLLWNYISNKHELLDIFSLNCISARVHCIFKYTFHLLRSGKEQKWFTVSKGSTPSFRHLLLSGDVRDIMGGATKPGAHFIGRVDAFVRWTRQLKWRECLQSYPPGGALHLSGEVTGAWWWCHCVLGPPVCDMLWLMESGHWVTHKKKCWWAIKQTCSRHHGHTVLLAK